MAPATISDADADDLFISTARGMVSSVAAFVVLKLSSNCFTLPFVETTSLPGPTKRFTISTASESSPPGLLHTSRIICAGLLFLSSINAFLTSLIQFCVKFVKRIYPVLLSSIP